MKFFLITAYFVLAPLVVFAHAVPNSYTPDHGGLFAESPSEVAVTFTDRIVPGSATFILYMATSGPITLSPSVSSLDPRTVSAPLPALSGGVTLVWGVTSLEDGHYTHGAFHFAVGESIRSVRTWRETLRDETTLATLLFAVATMLLVLRSASHFFFERRPRCARCVRAYTLLEGLLALTALLLVVSVFVFPRVGWVSETTEGGITIRLTRSADEPTMLLRVRSSEQLPAPLFEISNRMASVPPMPIPLSTIVRDDHDATYSFPTSIFTPHGKWHVSTTFVRGNHYDAHGAIEFDYPDDILVAEDRMTPSTTLGWSVVIFALMCLSFTLHRVILVLQGGHSHLETTEGVSGVAPLVAYAGALFSFAILVLCLVLLVMV